MSELDPLDQFWRCPVCGAGLATGAPATMSKPPRCSHGEMEQCTREGFELDFNRWKGESDAA
jgi:hypothetical protein